MARTRQSLFSTYALLQVGHGQVVQRQQQVWYTCTLVSCSISTDRVGCRHCASILSGTFAHVQHPPDPSSYSKPYYKQKGTPLSPSKGLPQPPKMPHHNMNVNMPLLTCTPLGQTSTMSAQPHTWLQSLLSTAQSVLSVLSGLSSSTVEHPLAK